MGEDTELAAMTQVAQALEGLDERTATRVIRWALDRFNISLGGGGTKSTPAPPKGDGAITENRQAEENHTDLPTIYDAANPTTASEKALVAGYWFQEIVGNEPFEAQAVNAKLKDLGHQVENITRAFDALQSTSPRLVIQTEKSGKSRQARKKYKVTVEGIRKVHAMMQAKTT